MVDCGDGDILRFCPGAGKEVHYRIRIDFDIHYRNTISNKNGTGRHCRVGINACFCQGGDINFVPSCKIRILFYVGDRGVFDRSVSEGSPATQD